MTRVEQIDPEAFRPRARSIEELVHHRNTVDSRAGFSRSDGKKKEAVSSRLFGPARANGASVNGGSQSIKVKMIIRGTDRPRIREEGMLHGNSIWESGSTGSGSAYGAVT